VRGGLSRPSRTLVPKCCAPHLLAKPTEREQKRDERAIDGIASSDKATRLTHTYTVSYHERAAKAQERRELHRIKRQDLPIHILCRIMSEPQKHRRDATTCSGSCSNSEHMEVEEARSSLRRQPQAHVGSSNIATTDATTTTRKIQQRRWFDTFFLSSITTTTSSSTSSSSPLRRTKQNNRQWWPKPPSSSSKSVGSVTATSSYYYYGLPVLLLLTAYVALSTTTGVGPPSSALSGATEQRRETRIDSTSATTKSTQAVQLGEGSSGSTSARQRTDDSHQDPYVPELEPEHRQRRPLPVVPKPDVKPPLSSLVASVLPPENKNNSTANSEQQQRQPKERIIGDVQWVLDFSVVGHSKTATTELMYWLAKHPQIRMHRREIYWLVQRKPELLVKDMYSLKDNHQHPGYDDYSPEERERAGVIRGYKSPHELQRKQVFQYYADYFPRTKMIVGIRHPVKWFESFYNFNWRQGNELPPAESYVGERFQGAVRYHEHLARLGKTPLQDPDEYQLLGRSEPGQLPNLPKRLTNPVFLYDPSQLFDTDPRRSDQFRTDLSDYLGLEWLLNPMENTRHGKGSDYHYKIDICEDQYAALRGELLEMGKNASKWILQYFMVLPDVHCSDEEGLIAKVRSWSVDPCRAAAAAGDNLGRAAPTKGIVGTTS